MERLRITESANYAFYNVYVVVVQFQLVYNSLIWSVKPKLLHLQIALNEFNRDCIYQWINFFCR